MKIYKSITYRYSLTCPANPEHDIILRSYKGMCYCWMPRSSVVQNSCFFSLFVALLLLPQGARPNDYSSTLHDQSKPWWIEDETTVRNKQKRSDKTHTAACDLCRDWFPFEAQNARTTSCR